MRETKFAITEDHVPGDEAAKRRRLAQIVDNYLRAQLEAWHTKTRASPGEEA